jgi:hypothetical protein
MICMPNTYFSHRQSLPLLVRRVVAVVLVVLAVIVRQIEKVDLDGLEEQARTPLPHSLSLAFEAVSVEEGRM